MAHPITYIAKLVGKDINALDNNPRIQLKIHTIGFWYWTVNFPVVAYLFFFYPSIWLKYGLFVTLIYSIYANWSTDYAGMSSAQAVINTGGTDVDVRANPLGGGVTIEGKSEKV